MLVVRGSDVSAARTCSLPKLEIENKVAYAIIEEKVPQLCRLLYPVALYDLLYSCWQHVRCFKSGKVMISDVSWLALALDSMVAARVLLMEGEHLSGGLDAAEAVDLMACAGRRLASLCRRELFLFNMTSRGAVPSQAPTGYG